MKSVLFVCLGNICRSPLAEGILRREAAQRGIPLGIDSAGTGDYHLGSLPDERACAEGISRGCEMTMRARQVGRDDFDRFDAVIAMDAQNYRNLVRMAGSNASKIHLMREFDPTAPKGAEVPDPYYGGAEEFAEVAEMLERAVDGLLSRLGGVPASQAL